MDVRRVLIFAFLVILGFVINIILKPFVSEITLIYFFDFWDFCRLSIEE